MTAGMDDAHGCYEFVADCRLREAASLFAHAWDPVLLAVLSEGPLRRRALADWTREHADTLAEARLSGRP